MLVSRRVIEESHYEYLENARIMFQNLDVGNKGIVSTQKMTELISMIEKDNELGIREKDIIEFGDPTFYGHMTFNFYIQALSQCLVTFDDNKMSILKFINDIAD